MLAAAVGVTSAVNVRPDLLVLGFTLGISILTGIVFGLVPALRSRDMEWKLGSAVRTPEFGMSRFNPAHALVVLQVSLTSVLLVAAGLLTHSLLALDHQDLGFNRDNLLLVRTDPRLAGYQPTQLFALYRQIQDRLNALPGVLSASIARHSPLSGYSSSSNFSIEGYIPPAGKNMDVYGVEVGPQFFETLGTPLLLGRPIGPRDTPASPAVAVVSESFVRSFFPGQNPIGRHFCLGSPFKAPGVRDHRGCRGLKILQDEREAQADGLLLCLAVRRTGSIRGSTPDPDVPRSFRRGPPYAGPFIISTAGFPSWMSQPFVRRPTIRYVRNG